MTQDESTKGMRSLISRVFTYLQDVVYIALGALLALSAFAVLLHGASDLVAAVAHRTETAGIITLLDRILLALMIVELLYTVQISFREHALVPEPFILVALIAAVRRILVITAEFGAQARPDQEVLRNVLSELGLLTILIVVLVGSLVVLHRQPAPARASAENAARRS